MQFPCCVWLYYDKGRLMRTWLGTQAEAEAVQCNAVEGNTHQKSWSTGSWNHTAVVCFGVC